MAEAVETAARPQPAPPPEELMPAREVDLGRSARLGLIGGGTAAFVSAVGMAVEFQEIEVVDESTLGYVVLLMIPALFAYMAASPPERLEGYAAPKLGVRNVLAGLIAGGLTGAVMVLFTAWIHNFDVRDVFTNISPELESVLLFERSLGSGLGLMMAASVALGAAGAGVRLLPATVRKPLLMALAWVLVFGLFQAVVRQVVTGLELDPVNELLFGTSPALTVTGAAVTGIFFFGLYYLKEARSVGVRERFDRLPDKQRRQVMTVVVLVLLVAVWGINTRVLNPFLAEVLDSAGIFLIMALGLNIVVGFAGLLDLGYVAFFAVGAYAGAVLTSPTAPAFSPELVFWLAIPFVMLAAAVSGLLVGTPVIRMRGDYLAIVTLGFGEIVRLLFLSDALKGTFGGARGIRQIPDVVVGRELQGPQDYLYLVIGLAVIAAYVSYALQDSRIGRAWMAMREDETVAEAMGVNIVAAKLWAFVIGAILASVGGAIFAAKIGSIFPNTFEINVSIILLVIVIVGGLGSVPGVALAALVLVGTPALLREFEAYRFLVYGAILILMMLNRPEGFIPSKRRARELHEDERSQDVWLKQEQERQERAEGAQA